MKIKKFCLAFGLPLFASVSLIGAGYATWYFNDTTAPTSNINANVLNYAAAGNLTLDQQTVFVNFDQSSQTDDATNGFERHGIYFSTTSGDFTTKIDKLTASYTPDATSPSKVSISWTIAVTGDNETSPYITYTAPEASTLTKTFDETTTTKTSFDVVSFTDLLAYATDKEPTTVAEYNAMKTELSDFKIEVTFTITNTK